MGLRLELGSGWVLQENTVAAKEDAKAPIVNLHPSFVFPKAEIGSPFAFPSIEFGSDMVRAAIAARVRSGLSPDLPKVAQDEPRRARITEEWDHLRAAWSLHRNGKVDLVEKRRAGFIPTAGYVDPPDTLADWVFQFAQGLGAPCFDEHFEALFQQLLIAKDKGDFGRFVKHFGDDMSSDHGRRHFEMAKAYFAAFSEFSQVHHLVTSGVPVGEEHAAASTNFDATRMFYGNAFEAFGANVEFLVCLNNLVEDRPYDQLKNITLSTYRQTDKAGRCNAIADNVAMAAICKEFDNQVRNASHHGGMVFDRASGVIQYRAGKGGQGDVRSMGYAAYLARCTQLFVQLSVLMRLEILVANEYGVRLPL
ncbi:hypothetical protein [Novosphingobium decolorationis]|uniref:hypothetical protein n=1 Tax=Novosphingobium decolorationis TaxID=2698673 RepID=UPI001BCB2CD7|nr:hypothetical protein [Novosphingobium decolorationis]